MIGKLDQYLIIITSQDQDTIYCQALIMIAQFNRKLQNKYYERKRQIGSKKSYEMILTKLG